LVLGIGLGGAASETPGDEAAAGVIVPCPGTSDPVPAGLPCGLVCRAALPTRQPESHIFLVDIQVNDKPALVVLDTGSDRTALSPVAATRLGLPPGTLPTERSSSPGEVSQTATTAMQSVTIGHARVGPGRIDLLPPTQGVAGMADSGIDGVLGNDILSHYQMDLDFRHHLIRLYEGKLCPGPLPGWAAEAIMVPITSRRDRTGVVVAASLDGVPIAAMLDTGSEGSIAWQTAAAEFHVKPDELARDKPISLLGFFPGTVARKHRFHTLGFTILGLDAMVVLDPIVAIVPAQTKHYLMIVGDMVLATRRVWVDYPERQVHFGPPD